MIFKQYRIFKPCTLLWLFFVLLIIFQLLFCSSHSVALFLDDKLPVLESSYGLGAPVQMSGIQEEAGLHITEFHIHWGMLFLNLFVCYVFSALAGTFIKRKTDIKRPFLVYLGTTVAIIGIAFFISIFLSRMYWGYFFKRPNVLPEIRDVSTVTGVIPVITEEISNKEYRFVFDTEFSLSERIDYGRKDLYYNLVTRLLIYLDDKSLLPDEVNDLPASYVTLYSLLPSTGLLAKPETGYNDSEKLSGVIITAENQSGTELFFFSLRGGQVSNDHYPYYEMVFEKHSQSDQLKFVRGQRFFYDVAGIEGLEYFSIWPYLSMIGIVLGFILVTLVGVVRKIASLRSQRNKSVAGAYRVPGNDNVKKH